MKPLNLDNSPCSPISSNCVIWQGPNIPCINLCTGDTVSDVVYKLALELCEILDQLNITNYDLACLNLPCPPEDFQTLIQILINKICELEGIPTPAPQPDGGDCPTNCKVAVALCLGGGTDNLVSYVNTIANKICDLVSEITEIQNSITNINITLVDLQTQIDSIPTYTLPDIDPDCAIGVYVGPTRLDTLFEAFLNDVWCPFSTVIGTPAEISSVLNPGCALTDIVSDPSWINPVSTLADSINNIWVSICYLYDNMPEYNIVAADDITVSSVSVGNLTTFTVGRTPKINFYADAVSSLDIRVDPGFVNMTYFMPLAYAGLTYTNATLATRDYIVQVSFDVRAYEAIGGAGTVQQNYIYGALIKNAATTLYESLSDIRPRIAMWDTVTNLPVDSTTVQQVQTVPAGNPVELGLVDKSTITDNISFFYKVSLLSGESVSLKFKGDTVLPANLLKAQMFVQEL